MGRRLDPYSLLSLSTQCCVKASGSQAWVASSSEAGPASKGWHRNVFFPKQTNKQANLLRLMRKFAWPVLAFNSWLGERNGSPIILPRIFDTVTCWNKKYRMQWNGTASSIFRESSHLSGLDVGWYTQQALVQRCFYVPWFSYTWLLYTSEGAAESGNWLHWKALCLKCQ